MRHRLRVGPKAVRLPRLCLGRRAARPTIFGRNRRALTALAVAGIMPVDLLAGIVETIAPQRAQPAALIQWKDDTGRVRKLSDFAGYPVLLLPVYTRCRGACIANVDQLEKALANSSADPKEFRVLLFSFDSSDTPSVLADYRARERIPLGWFVGTASQSNIDALLKSIGFQYGKAGSEFMHPNLVVVLDSNLHMAKWIYGSSYTTRDIDRALKVAAGESDWVGRHSDLLYALLLFAASILCVALSYSLIQLYSIRQAESSEAHESAASP